AEQAGMNRRNAIGAVRTDDGQIGHANFALGAFLDQADAGYAGLVARETSPDVVQQPPVDLVDNLQVTRQEHLEPDDRPFLERLGQKGMVRVCKSLLSDIPGLVPAELCLVE